MQHSVTGAKKKGKFEPLTRTDLTDLESRGGTLRLTSTLPGIREFDVDVDPPSPSAFQVGNVRRYTFPRGAKRVDGGRGFGYAELTFDLATSDAKVELR